MNSFRIRCTTCSTKLRVKDASLVGHILSCPKCGSMVQVPDPAGPDPENMLVRESSDSKSPQAPSTPTKRPAAPPPIKFSESGSLFGDAAAMLSEPETSLESTSPSPSSSAPDETRSQPAVDLPAQKPAAPPAPKLEKPPETPPQPSAAKSSERAEESGSVILPMPEAEQPPAKRSRKVAAAAVAAVIPPVPEVTSDSPTVPPEQSTPVEPESGEPTPIQPQAFAAPAGMGVWRIAAISGGVAAVASVLVVVTLQAFLGGGSGDQVARNQNQIQQSSPPDVAEIPTDEQPAQPDEPPTTEAAPPAQPIPEETAPASDSSAAEPAVNETSESEAAEPDEPAAEAPPAAQPAGERQDNPFLFDPPTKPATGQVAGESTAEEPASEPQTNAEQASSPSMKFREDPLYDVFGESFPVFDNEMLEATASLPDLEPEAPLDAAGARDQTTKMLPPIDVESRLADPVAAINFERIPLINFVRFVSRMTNMPISVSPEALDRADVSPNTLITVKLKDTSVEKMLASALIPQGLAGRSTTRGVRVDIPQTLNGQPRTTRLACDDLVSNDKELADLAYLLVNLVEPGSWKTAGGEGQYRLEGMTIIVSQHESALFSSILFLEKLRVARGLSPRSNYAKRLFTLDTRRQQLAPKLQQNIAAQFVVPTPIDQLVEHLERQASVSILCDWESLATDGVSPESLASLSALQVPLEKALDDLCAELNVRWRPTSGGAIQVMGSQDYANLPYLEFYSADKFAQNRPAAAALIKRAESKLEDLPRHKAGRILYDPKSGYFLARLTANDHQRLAKFLQSQLP